MSEPTRTIIAPTDDKTNIEIIPFGTDERIKLNVQIVQNIIAVPTKTGKLPDSRQAIKFMMLCKARHLNPFEGDAYLLGYDTQSGPQFSLITAHQVFLKRAEASEGFDGMQSGVIVKTVDGIEEREGDMTVEGDELLGGWAKVHRSDRKYPFYRRLKLSTFNTGQSRWAKDAAGMIVKCAEADALRSAFPTHLGGLYVSEERAVIDVAATTVPIERPQITGGPSSAVQPEKPKKPGKKAKEIVAELEKRLKIGERDHRHLLALAIKNEWIDAPKGYTGNLDDLNDVPLLTVPEDKLQTWLNNFEEIARQLDETTPAQPARTEETLPFE